MPETVKKSGRFLVDHWPIVLSIVAAIAYIITLFWDIKKEILTINQKITVIEQTVIEIKQDTNKVKDWQLKHLENYHSK